MGEEITKAYLEHIKGCEFIQTNLYTKETQGEIDVIGIDLHKNKVYVCEVTVHLQTGLQYNKDKRPNNVNKLVEKFSRDIEYAQKYLAKYEQIFMFWCPIVKNQKESAKYNQLDDLRQVQEIIKTKYGVEITLIINEKFLECFDELRAHARKETTDIKSPVLRLLQIEEYTKAHVEKLGK